MSNITEAEDEAEILGGVILASEDWAKGYKKNKDSFAKLIKLETKIERIMRAYLRDLAKERLTKYINWSEYAKTNVKAYRVDVTVDVEEIDDLEYDALLSVIHDPLVLSIALGAETAEAQYNIELGLNQYSSEVLQAAETYTAKMVKGITDTTRDRIKQSISTSLHLGEDTQTAADRLSRIINDPRRAAMIARTESVRSYTRGIEVFGKKSGATRKYWELSSDPCDICLANFDAWGGDDGVEFDTDLDPPPGHPNCRCNEGLAHDYSSSEGDDEE